MGRSSRSSINWAMLTLVDVNMVNPLWLIHILMVESVVSRAKMLSILMSCRLCSLKFALNIFKVINHMKTSFVMLVRCYVVQEKSHVALWSIHLNTIDIVSWSMLSLLI